MGESIASAQILNLFHHSIFRIFAILKMNTDLIEMNEFEKCDLLQQSFNNILESGLLNNGPIPNHPFKLTLWRQ